MTRVVNLRHRRKQASRDKAREQASRQAAAHGIPRPVRDLATARRAQQEAALDGHLREDRGSDQPADPET